MTSNKKKFNNQEAADYLNIRPNTLEVWRCKHKGPRYSKLGTRVLYDVDDLEEFFKARAVDTMESQTVATRSK